MSISTSPDFFTRVGSAIADRINPIVVKEVRQGLRTRAFWVFFSLMLLACLIISLIAVAAHGQYDLRTGQGAFAAYFVTLGLVLFFVIPYSSYRSMAREREDETWVLLTLTGLGPRRIIVGKLMSSVIQGSLYASAAAPFLLFSYYLQGLDLPTIVAAMVLAVTYLVFLTSVSVSAATLAESRLMRGLLHFGVLGGLLQGVVLGFSVSTALVAQFGLTSKPYFAFAVAVALFAMSSTAFLFFEGAAARLSLRTEPYARGPRLAFMIQFLGIVLFFALFGVFEREHEVLAVGSVAAPAYVSFIGAMVLSDRDGDSALQRARTSVSLLRPGALRGFGVALLMLAISLVVFVLASMQVSSMTSGELRALWAAPAYALIYLSAAQVLARLLPHQPSHTAGFVRVLFLVLAIVGVGLPPLLGELFYSDAELAWLNIFNPAVGLANLASSHTLGQQPEMAIVSVWVVALVLTLLAVVMLWRRDRSEA